MSPRLYKVNHCVLRVNFLGEMQGQADDELLRRYLGYRAVSLALRSPRNCLISLLIDL